MNTWTVEQSPVKKCARRTSSEVAAEGLTRELVVEAMRKTFHAYGRGDVSKASAYEVTLAGCMRLGVSPSQAIVLTSFIGLLYPGKNYTNLSSKDIAERYSVPVGSVKSDISRLRLKHGLILRDQMGPRVYNTILTQRFADAIGLSMSGCNSNESGCNSNVTMPVRLPGQPLMKSGSLRKEEEEGAASFSETAKATAKATTEEAAKACRASALGGPNVIAVQGTEE